MKAVLYTRVSSERQDVDLSISAQLSNLRKYAADNGYEVVREYVDEVESGRTSDRLQFQKMVSDARRKTIPFGTILVWKYSRFARNREDSILYKSLLRKHEVRVVSMTEPFEDTPTGRLLEAIIESLDEFYSANLAQEIVRGMRESASRGFYMPSRAPYGYKRVKVADGSKERPTLEIDPKSAPLIKRMFRDFLVARGLKNVTKSLNNDGIPSPRGKKWNKSSVHKVLVNPAYTGKLVWGVAGKSGLPPVVVENAWEALIDKDTFDKVQATLKSRSFQKVHPRRTGSRFLLSGLVRCGSCNRTYSGTTAKSGKFSYYVCGSKLQKGGDSCEASYLPSHSLEARVINVIRDFVLQEEHLRKLVDMVAEEMEVGSSSGRQHLVILDEEADDVERRLDRLYDALETGLLSMEDLAPRIRALRERQERLKQARVLAEVEVNDRSMAEIDIGEVKEHIVELQELLALGTIAERRSFISSFVKEIEIYGSEAAMTYTMPIGNRGEVIKNGVLSIVPYGGTEGTRTPYPLLANHVFTLLIALVALRLKKMAQE